MQSNTYGPMSHSSSTTASLHEPAVSATTQTDDFTVLHRFRNKTEFLGKRLTFHEPLFNDIVSHRLPAEGEKPLPTHSNNLRRRSNTSITWTSSDGEITAREDEIDDRSCYIDEYNRLARKVSIIYRKSKI
jgi:hypothetical protein